MSAAHHLLPGVATVATYPSASDGGFLRLLQISHVSYLPATGSVLKRQRSDKSHIRGGIRGGIRERSRTFANTAANAAANVGFVGPLSFQNRASSRQIGDMRYLQ